LCYLLLSIFFLQGFSLSDHVINISLGETTRSLDGDGLISSGGFVSSTNMDDTVSINIESDFNLRNSSNEISLYEIKPLPRSRRNTAEIELTQQLVISSHFSFTLEDSDGDSGLIISSSREDLGFLGGDGGISLDHSGENTSQSFNTQRKRSDIKKQDILDISDQDTSLDGSTHGNGFIRVNSLAWRLSENVLDKLLNLGHSGHTSDKDDFINFVLCKTGILQALFAWLNGLLQEIISQGFQLGSGKSDVAMLGATSISSQERKVDFSLEGRREFDLSLFSSFSDSLDSKLILGDINSGLSLEFVNDPFLNDGINILRKLYLERIYFTSPPQEVSPLVALTSKTP